MTNTYTIPAFYKFVELADYEELKPKILKICNDLGIKGTILLAKEGINATIAGKDEAITEFFKQLKSDKRFEDLEYKISYAEEQPFQRMKVRLKNEIIRMNRPDLNWDKAGIYVEAEEWDKLLEDPEVVVVDTRNRYEVKLGKFENAIDPEVMNFRDFPEWVDENLDPEKHKKVAMYCTGGIRCEKSTALLNEKGFEAVYHLKGGILQYFEDTENKNGKWEGDCFVFDERLAVDDKLAPSKHLRCQSCAVLLDSDDMKSAAEKLSNPLLCLECSGKAKAKAS